MCEKFFRIILDQVACCASWLECPRPIYINLQVKTHAVLKDSVPVLFVIEIRIRDHPRLPQNLCSVRVIMCVLKILKQTEFFHFVSVQDVSATLYVVRHPCLSEIARASALLPCRAGDSRDMASSIAGVVSPQIAWLILERQVTAWTHGRNMTQHDTLGIAVLRSPPGGSQEAEEAIATPGVQVAQVMVHR